MCKPQVHVFPDVDSLNLAAAELISASLDSALRQKDEATFVLSGGSTPKPVYELLASPPFLKRLDWERIHFFWSDERCVPPDNRESNFRMGWNTLVSKVHARADHVHRMMAELEDGGKAALRYEAEIRRVASDMPVPRMDLILLGLGGDGHTASLFPGMKWSEERLVATHYVPQLEANRMTMLPRLLNEARRIVFLVAGIGKAPAVAGVLDDETADYPAKRIKPAAGSVTWMIDGGAASLLRTM